MVAAASWSWRCPEDVARCSRSQPCAIRHHERHHQPRHTQPVQLTGASSPHCFSPLYHREHPPEQAGMGTEPLPMELLRSQGKLNQNKVCEQTAVGEQKRAGGRGHSSGHGHMWLKPKHPRQQQRKMIPRQRRHRSRFSLTASNQAQAGASSECGKGQRRAGTGANGTLTRLIAHMANPDCKQEPALAGAAASHSV